MIKRMKGFFPNRLVVECLLKEESDFRYAVFYRNFAYYAKDASVIVVPVGFKTDFASIPWAFRQFIPKTGKYNEAAVVHDYLCYLWKKGGYDRVRADDLFYEMMDVLGVKWHRRKFMWFGVRAYTKALKLPVLKYIVKERKKKK